MAQPTFTVRLPVQLREHLSAHAAAQHKTRNAVVIEALERYLDAHEEAALQALIDEDCERMNIDDREDADYQHYLEGDVDPWEEIIEEDDSRS